MLDSEILHELSKLIEEVSDEELPSEDVTEELDLRPGLDDQMFLELHHLVQRCFEVALDWDKFMSLETAGAIVGQISEALSLPC